MAGFYQPIKRFIPQFKRNIYTSPNKTICECAVFPIPLSDLSNTPTKYKYKRITETQDLH